MKYIIQQKYYYYIAKIAIKKKQTNFGKFHIKKMQYKYCESYKLFTFFKLQ